MLLGHKIKAFRESQKPKMTQGDLAKKAGVSRSLISKLEVAAKNNVSLKDKEIGTASEIAILKAIGQFREITEENILKGLSAVIDCQSTFGIHYPKEVVAKMIYAIAAADSDESGKKMLLQIFQEEQGSIDSHKDLNEISDTLDMLQFSSAVDGLEIGANIPDSEQDSTNLKKTV